MFTLQGPVRPHLHRWKPDENKNGPGHVPEVFHWAKDWISVLGQWIDLLNIPEVTSRLYIGINRHILRRWDVLDVQSSPFRETFQRMVNLVSILSFGDWIITRCDDLWYSSQTIDIWYVYWHLPVNCQIYNGPYIEFDDVCYFIFVEWIFGISIFLVSEDPAF